MADPEHLEILKQGVEAWNDWRFKEWQTTPDLSKANLESAQLQGADLSQANLQGANLSHASLHYAKLNRANLSKADLRWAYVIHTNVEWGDLREAVIEEAVFSDADVRFSKFGPVGAKSAKFYRGNLTGVDFRGADLRYAKFDGVELDEAKFSGADLRESDLTWSHLIRADLRDANLRGAKLAGVNFDGSTLEGADITDARLIRTIFFNTNLTRTIGLETCRHEGPSNIDHLTLKNSGRLPVSFLRGCGLPETLIEYLPSILNEAIQFYSCFISYSSRDQEFAERLHADLQAKGVRVWFAPHDMKIGARIRPTIDESIRVYDKLLLVLSENSVGSQWVEQEVETALRKERQGGGTVLFPVRLDDSVFEIAEGWPALVKDTRHVGDFTRWKDHDSYWKSFERLLRDLKAGA